MRPRRWTIQRGLREARAGVPGRLLDQRRQSAGRPTAAGTSRRTATSAWASASRGQLPLRKAGLRVRRKAAARLRSPKTARHQSPPRPRPSRSPFRHGIYPPARQTRPSPHSTRKGQGTPSRLGQAPRRAGRDDQFDRHEICSSRPASSRWDRRKGKSPSFWRSQATSDRMVHRPSTHEACCLAGTRLRARIRVGHRHVCVRGPEASGSDHEAVLLGGQRGDAGAVRAGDGERIRAAFKEDANCPVEMVNWDEASAFCRKLGELSEEGAGDGAYRLPTEAEWEYACRAGTTTTWYSGPMRLV